MSTSVVYPVGIAPSLGHFFSSQNDIEIYVEDKATTNMWRNLLRKFLPREIAFSDPIQLGDRNRVIEECRNDQGPSNRKRLYIIDADLDVIKGKSKPRLKHLYRLRAYCIENYLYQENAILSACQVVDVNISSDEARDRLDLENWENINFSSFQKLFACYALVHSLADSNQTVSYHVERLVLPNPNADRLCTQKINGRIRELYRSLLRTHEKQEIKVIKEIVDEKSISLDWRKYVSGKDYILKLLFKRIRVRFGNQLSDEQLKVLISQNIDAGYDPYLVRRLQKICL